MTRWLGGIALLLVLAVALVYVAGLGVFGTETHAGKPEARARAKEIVGQRADAEHAAAQVIGVGQPKQILFGDLHVHTTFSFDAFQLSLPMSGGDGAHPVADACDYARHCAALDFWSITDHDLTLTPRMWKETIETIRQCNALAENPESPDMVSYLGWEWTQVGATPKDHWGHKNVILRDLDDAAIPARPIAARIPLMGASEALRPSPFLLGLLALTQHGGGGADFARYMNAQAVPECPDGVPVRDLPLDCRESVATPGELFAKLHEWNVPSIVIPHGTTWGFYTPLGSSWDKQLTPEQHDPSQQKLIEVYSGHGNSEEFRPYREVEFAADGTASCPAPADNYLPSCWRAGEIIEARCRTEGGSEEDCAERAATARQNYVDAANNGGAATVPAAKLIDWQDSGQCRDCFQPAFNFRPRSSVQYIMSLEKPSANPLRFRFGFIGSSDNHSGRPGTGYKEVARTEFTETRFGTFLTTPIGKPREREPVAQSERYETHAGEAPFAAFETERQASFFLNGGLAAVHAEGRSRQAIWDAMQRREVYGTSGPHILLWLDLLNGPEGKPMPMGSEVSMSDAPIFQVRAVGSFEQKPGCPPDAAEALGEERTQRLCQGECYNPGDKRRPITRIEVVRIRPGEGPDAGKRIEDPWQVIQCPDPAGCQAAFTDPDFTASDRDVLYYVRAIEAPSGAVDGNPLGCTYDAEGRCTKVDPCFGRPKEDECLAQIEERAWSSPIFVNHAAMVAAPAAEAPAIESPAP